MGAPSEPRAPVGPAARWRRVALAAVVTGLAAGLPGPSAAAGEGPSAAAREPSRGSLLLLARAGVRDGVSFRYLQAVHGRGRWVGPDVGYLDFGDAGAYREAWIGGGGVVHASPSWLVMLEGFVARAFGTRARGETYVQPWTLVAWRPGQRLSGELVALTYLPLDRHGTRQLLLDRAKVEVDLGRFRLGAGYAGFQLGDAAWQHRPFVTTTLEGGRLGDLELWLQHVEPPGGGSDLQVQVRYSLRRGL